ncbi:MAG: hypothetical protein BWY29_00946 [Microgenomates group bacterium ADurb.Bin238]|jgi:hypothetical protein|nr:MAG: hypothetical protein BWY29_00946 [Microgenomates group bacterium ADurb.Bin238]
MTDLNEKYVFEETTITDVKDKPIVRTYAVQQEEKFTIKELEEKIARIEEGRDAYVAERNAEIAAIQAKIDEATTALVVK